MEYKIEKYVLKLIDFEDNTCKTELSPQSGQAFLKERRKLYIVYNNSEVLYVGEAHTSIKIRFQRGCTSYNFYKRNKDIARGGYKGYKWLNKEYSTERNLILSVVIFPQEYDSNREFIEAIEGELVYLIRNITGNWPVFQNEIHFSNSDEAKVVAQDLLNIILNEKKYKRR